LEIFMHIGVHLSRAYPSIEANVVQIVQLCRAYHALGHQVTLFIPRDEAFTTDEAALAAGRRTFGDDLPFAIVFIPRWRLFGRFEVLGTVKGLLRKLREHPVDVVYTLNHWSVFALHRARVPFVFELHETRLHFTSKFIGWMLQRMIVRWARREDCKLIVAISAALAKIWQGYGAPAEKFIVAHDAVELSLFDPSLPKGEARAQLHLPPEKKLVVYTGSLTADRGMDLVMAAARELPQFDFHIVGGTDEEVAGYRADVQRQQLTYVHFVGRVEHKQIPLWCAAADILLMMWTWKVPTIRGCSPMKVFEYMAAGRLIVGPAFPTVCEVLENGTDAILFEPDDLPAMIAALREAETKIDDPTLPRRARQKVAEKYTWEVRCRRILNALAERGIR
jgi:glycosyltransferase involved in cell wall biosynthesis